MAAPVFIGDELTGAGYRLAGADARICEPADAADELARARETAPLVLIAASHAGGIPEDQLAIAEPPVIVVSTARGVPPPDLGERVRRELGVLE